MQEVLNKVARLGQSCLREAWQRVRRLEMHVLLLYRSLYLRWWHGQLLHPLS